jgi:hypothetical protein
MEELKPIILKRHHMEEWIDQEFNFFHDFVVGAFVKFHDKHKMRIARIEDCRENENILPYRVADMKKKTTI